MVRNAAWLAGSALLLRAVSMLFQVYLSGRIGAAGLGLMQLILTVGGLASTMALAGGKIAAMYLISRAAGRGDENGVCSAVSTCLRYALVVGGTVAAGMLLLAPTIAAHYVQDAAALPALRVYAALLPCSCLCAVMSGYCTARGRVRRLVLVELLERFLSIALTVALLHRADGRVAQAMLAIVWGSGAPPLLSFALLYGFYRRERRCLGPGRRRPMLRALLQVSIPLALGDLLRSGLNTVEQFLIPFGLAKTGSRDFGLSAYGTILGMVFPVLLFPAAILHAVSDLLVPELSRCAVQHEFARIRRLTARCFRLTLLFAGVISGLLFCAAGKLGQLLYHSADAGRYLRLFSPMVLFLYLDVIVDGMLKGLGMQVHTVRYNTATNVIDVTGLYLLVPRLGIQGYVLTYTVSHLVNFFLSLRLLLRVTAGETASTFSVS